MESQVGNLIQDQNLNDHFKGASARGKNNVAKAPRKGALGRKPLGDLSNSIQPTSKQSMKKQNSSMFSFTEKETGYSKLKFDGSKKKTSGRRVLSDISNSWTQQLNEAPKKNLSTKVSVVAEEDLDAICEEGFLHNHEECIKAHTKATDMDEFLKTVGLYKGSTSSSQVVPPVLEEVDDLLSKDEFPWKHEEFSDHDSPPPCRSPKSPNRFMTWVNTEDGINFMPSFESPNFKLKSP
ncbi:hypothetical protein Ddye_013810 [Dipteronia dyeriana]|uniref:Uncharacterized protein n=1 Tax=Dipteronia dyeriana TaxID=168575 RepID=A0AAD9X725_9ROSI|nr:hypothetical protein Ddye_013810 [Dipteronia dyeriana]